MSLRDILAGIGPRVVSRGRQADGGRMVDGWRCCESASCATGGLHGGQVAPGLAPVVSLSVCGVIVPSHSGGIYRSIGHRARPISACGVTLQLHGGGVAGDVRVLVVGICLRCNCSVAWWADIGVRKPSGLCISPRCDRSVTRQADTSAPGLTAVCSPPVVLRRDIRQPPVHQAPPEIPALLPQRVGRGVR